MRTSTLRASIAAAVLLGARPANRDVANHSAPAPFELPAPTGPFAVGTTTWRLTDPSRQETFTDRSEPRNVEVLDLVSDDRRAVARSRLTCARGWPRCERSRASFGAPETTFDTLEHVRTHAQLDAPPVATAAGCRCWFLLMGIPAFRAPTRRFWRIWPATATPSCSIVHPFEASAATLADGRVVRMLDTSGSFLKPIADVFNEWGPEDETMASVAKNTDEARATPAAARISWRTSEDPFRAAALG